jgi:hypothetical protein
MVGQLGKSNTLGQINAAVHGEFYSTIRFILVDRTLLMHAVGKAKYDFPCGVEWSDRPGI